MPYDKSTAEPNSSTERAGASGTWRAAQSFDWGDSNSSSGRVAPTRPGRDWSDLRTLAVKIRILIFRLGLIGMALVFATALAVGTFWITAKGLGNFNTAAPIALAFALGIQGTLWIASWITAREWSVHKMARRKALAAAAAQRRDSGRMLKYPKYPGFVRQHPGKVLMVLIPMAASIFFSSSSLFDTVFEEKIRTVTNISVARSVVSAITGDLDLAIRRQRGQDAEALKASPEWKNYQSGIEKILDMADKSADLIRIAVQKDRQAAEAAAASTRSDVLQRQGRLAAINERLRVLEMSVFESKIVVPTTQDFATIDAEIAKRKTEALQLEDDSQRLARELVDEDKRGKGKRESGRGTEYGKLEREKQSIDGQLDIVRREITQLQNRRKEFITAQDKEQREATGRRAANESEVTRLSAEKNALQGELAGVQSRLNEEEARVLLLGGRFRSSGPASGSAGGPLGRNPIQSPAAAAKPEPTDENTAAELSNRVRLAITNFLGTGARKAYSQMVEGCSKLQDILGRHTATAAAVANVFCDTASFAPAVDRLQESDAARTAFLEACPIDDKFNALTEVKDYINFGRTCMSKTKLPSRDLAAFASRLDDIERVNNPNSSHFDRAIASLQRGDRLAWIALALAFVFDGLIFIAALAGAQMINSPTVRSGLVDSTQAHRDIMLTGEADTRVFGDEPRWVLMSKLFLGAIQLVPLRDGSVTRTVSELQLDRVPATHRSGIAAILSAAGERLARPNGENRYVVEQAFVQDHSAIVARYEREWHWLNRVSRSATDPGLFPADEDHALVSAQGAYASPGRAAQPTSRAWWRVVKNDESDSGTESAAREPSHPDGDYRSYRAAGSFSREQAEPPGRTTGRSGPRTRWLA